MVPTHGPFSHPCPVTIVILSLWLIFANAAFALTYAGPQSPTPPLDVPPGAELVVVPILVDVVLIGFEVVDVITDVLVLVGFEVDEAEEVEGRHCE